MIGALTPGSGMEFISEYTSELIFGASGTIGSLVVWILKGFGSKIAKIDSRLAKLETDLEVNTALDKMRNGKK